MLLAEGDKGASAQQPINGLAGMAARMRLRTPLCVVPDAFPLWHLHRQR